MILENFGAEHAERTPACAMHGRAIERVAASPGTLPQAMIRQPPSELDVRDVLPAYPHPRPSSSSIPMPSAFGPGRSVAISPTHIAGARYVELPGASTA